MKRISLCVILAFFAVLACALNAQAAIEPMTQEKNAAKIFYDQGLKAVEAGESEIAFEAFTSCLYYCGRGINEMNKFVEQANLSDQKAVKLLFENYDAINYMMAMSYVFIGNYYYGKRDNAQAQESYNAATDICESMISLYSKPDKDKESLKRWKFIYEKTKEVVNLK